MRGPCVLLIILCCLTTGCHHGGTVPPGWSGTPILAPNNPDSDNDARDDHLNATLQIIICYGRVLSNHTALRLESPGQPTLMWDPGGTYKRDDPSYARRYDVISRNAPTIEQWWLYRWRNCLEPVMEVFEWSLEADLAQRLHKILLTRQDPWDTSQTFEPDAGGLECCKRTCEFLDRFAQGRPTVPDRYFWPHELGEHLWAQQPDRVRVFRKEGQSMVYTRDPDGAMAE